MEQWKYRPNSRFLVCVDSDGCVMDTMNAKHLLCFGPQWVEVFQLQQRKQEAMELWLSINLFSGTRGINRFQGLALACRHMVKQGVQIEDVEALETWVAATQELSEPALSAYATAHPSPCLERALRWSKQVNRCIAEMPQQDKPFPMAAECLAQLSAYADIVGVSSANAKAVNEEWERHGLRRYTRCLCCQEDGTKAEIIRRLLCLGYAPQDTLMVGDAPGDRSAAQKNGVHFYPILVGHERESWSCLQTEIFPRLLRGTFDAALQKELVEEMQATLH